MDTYSTLRNTGFQCLSSFSSPKAISERKTDSTKQWGVCKAPPFCLSKGLKTKCSKSNNYFTARNNFFWEEKQTVLRGGGKICLLFETRSLHGAQASLELLDSQCWDCSVSLRSQLQLIFLKPDYQRMLMLTDCTCSLWRSSQAQDR